ncbi:MAG: hypothetical protein DHS20C06_02050 [Hyphobacterium sp.]|nr:MAG: hypothetical protein DHS20C06_02050 [Hyphobacterium sp.]
MRIHYFVTASALLLAACSGEPSGSSADVALTEDGSAIEQARAANETYSEDEAIDGRSIDGRWGIQYEACSPDNELGDGVVLISRYDVIIGLDACSITGSSETGDGYALRAMCNGSEGGQYEQTFYFSTPQDGVMRWDNREFNRLEDYISCDGGAMH